MPRRNQADRQNVGADAHIRPWNEAGIVPYKLFFMCFHFFYSSKRNNYIFPFFGKARVKERKMLSSESVGLSKKATSTYKSGRNKRSVGLPQAREAMAALLCAARPASVDMVET